MGNRFLKSRVEINIRHLNFLFHGHLRLLLLLLLKPTILIHSTAVGLVCGGRVIQIWHVGVHVKLRLVLRDLLPLRHWRAYAGALSHKFVLPSSYGRPDEWCFGAELACGHGLIVEVQALEVCGPSSRYDGRLGRERSSAGMREFRLLKLEGTGRCIFESVEVGVECAYSWVGGAEALKTVLVVVRLTRV